MSSGTDEYWKAQREDRRMQEHLHNFKIKHQDADEIVVNKSGEPCAAIYYSIQGKNTMDMVSFFRKIKEFFMER